MIDDKVGITKIEVKLGEPSKYLSEKSCGVASFQLASGADTGCKPATPLR